MYTSFDNHQGFPAAETHLTIHRNDTNRVNPSELRFLRQKVADMHRPDRCLDETIRIIVVSADVALGMDLSQEERVIRAEYEAKGAMQPFMVAIH